MGCTRDKQIGAIHSLSFLWALSPVALESGRESPFSQAWTQAHLICYSLLSHTVQQGLPQTDAKLCVLGWPKKSFGFSVRNRTMTEWLNIHARTRTHTCTRTHTRMHTHAHPSWAGGQGRPDWIPSALLPGCGTWSNLLSLGSKHGSTNSLMQVACVFKNCIVFWNRMKIPPGHRREWRWDQTLGLELFLPFSLRGCDKHRRQIWPHRDQQGSHLLARDCSHPSKDKDFQTL